MNERQVRKLLEGVRAGRLRLDQALDRLRTLPYEDLGFARLDTHRDLRRGFPEIVYGEGKSEDQIVKIARRLHRHGSPVLISRLGPIMLKRLRRRLRGLKDLAPARLALMGSIPRPARGADVLVIAAGTADLPVAEEAAVMASLLGCAVDRLTDVGVAGVHRLFGELPRLRRARAVVVVAGMEGALPSLVAGLLDRPVIGVPTSIGYGTGLKGVAALMSMLNSCATGLLVVNIDNGLGAGYSAGIIAKGSQEKKQKKQTKRNS
ncbi:MAG: nickel pincer cofactor biosynthesis protein LarB [Acidobacteria bacterium]|nr:nickel pincer cofactor biosynthesis protein LarB [Acidobacteriota bacterium]